MKRLICWAGLALLLILLLWGIDALLYGLFSRAGGFEDVLRLHLPPYEIFFRAIVLILLLIITVASAALMADRRAHARAMREAQTLIRDRETRLRSLNEQLTSANQQLKASLQQLDAGNQQLKAEEQQLKAMNQELAESEQALLESRAHYRRMTINMPGIVYQFQLFPDGRRLFPYVSPKCRMILGLEPEVVRDYPEKVMDMVHADDRAELDRTIAESAAKLAGWNWEGRFMRGNSEHWLQGIAQPQRMEDGSILWDGIFIDITGRRRAEDRIRASLREKELMLKEIHHRVKNNLQVISSLLNLQAAHVVDPRDMPLFIAGQERVHAMALVHEKLYQSSDLAHINFNDYLRNMMTELQQIHRVGNIHLQLDAPGVLLTIEKAIPCGLIAHELVVNAMLHAFPAPTDALEGRFIRIALCDNESNGWRMVVSDNGIGLPADIDVGRVGTLGLQLVNILTRQIKGKLLARRAGGTTFEIDFPKD